MSEEESCKRSQRSPLLPCQEAFMEKGCIHLQFVC